MRELENQFEGIEDDFKGSVLVAFSRTCLLGVL